MAWVLLVGYDPETVDFSDPALPPGMTAEKVHAGIAIAMRQFAERGWEADVCLIRPDETAGLAVARQLASKSYDCVVVGGGVRLPPRGLALFEVVINFIHKAAPGAAIAFNTRRQRRCCRPMVGDGKPGCIVRRPTRPTAAQPQGLDHAPLGNWPDPLQSRRRNREQSPIMLDIITRV